MFLYKRVSLIFFEDMFTKKKCNVHIDMSYIFLFNEPKLGVKSLPRTNMCPLVNSKKDV